MNNNGTTANKLYRTIWRWHFYAGLFCIPFILTLAISGSIYLFKPQIDSWLESPYMQLAAQGTRSSPQQQIDVAVAAFPGAIFSSYRLPQNQHEAVVITIDNSGVKQLVYVNPDTLEILKTIASNSQFIRLVRSFHGELLMGDVGSILVELAGCWAIVMIITGLYLWWPRSARGIAGVLYPRLNRGGRQFWRDLHAVSGFWVAFFTLFLLISGLPWALVWGSAFKEIRSFGTTVVQQDWSVRNSAPLHDHREHASTQSMLLLTENLLAKAELLNFAPPVELAPARNNANQWHLASQHQNRMLRREVWFDGQTEEIVKTKEFQDKSGTDQIIGIGISAHEGQLFGWLNQLLGVFTTFGLIAVSVSGFILWRKRKPDGVLGAPPPVNINVSKIVWGITLGLALLLPLLAISLLVLIILEYCCFRHIAGLRRWLGLGAV